MVREVGGGGRGERGEERERKRAMAREDEEMYRERATVIEEIDGGRGKERESERG